MNVDLEFSQSQYGLLDSVAFTSLFAVASLGAGVASDHYNRKVLTIAPAVAWSVATLGTALSTSNEQVVIWPTGLACAFSTTRYSKNGFRRIVPMRALTSGSNAATPDEDIQPHKRKKKNQD